MTRAWQKAVELDPRALRAWPFLPLRAPVGSTWLSDIGEAVRVLPDGTVAPVVAFGAKSIASDPCASRRAA
jgi:hypothetical protein